MTEEVSICESLLALINAKSGSETMVSCLEFLGKRCNATAAAIEVDDLQGHIDYTFGWAEGNVSDTERLCAGSSVGGSVTGDCFKSRTEVFELSASAIGRTVLVVNLADGEIPVAVSSNLALIRSFFWLVLDRTLSEQQREATSLSYKAVSSEMTDLIEGERSARELAERLTAILNALPDLVFEITPEGRYTDFIAGPPDLMAGAQEKLPGKTIEEILPPDVATVVRHALHLILRDGKCPPVRYKLEILAGWHWFEIAGARKPPSQQGDAPTAIFVIRDVTEDVRQQEEISRLGKIVETMTNLVAIVDQKLRIVWVNNAWECRTGWTLDEVRGQDLATLVRCTDVSPESAKKVSEAIENNLAFHGETINCDRHGNRYWVDFNILPLFETDGSVQGYVSVETDITQQKENIDQIGRMAAEEQKMRNHLQNAIEALPDGVVIWDKDERLVVVNSAYASMYPEIKELLVEGVLQEEILRVGVERRAFPDAWGREDEWMAEQYERYNKPSVDTVQRADGRSIRRLDLRTSDGGRVAVRIDTTTAQQQMAALDSVNRALDDAQRSLSQIIDSADVGTWEWDVESDGVRIGGRYAEMLGYTAAELGPASDEMFRGLVHPEDMALLDSNEESDFVATADENEPVREHELRMRHKDGSWKWVLSRSAVTERFADGRHKKVVGIHLNVTDRKRLEDELRSSQSFMVKVMDGSISAIAVMNEEGSITYANAEAEQFQSLQRAWVKASGFWAWSWYGWQLVCGTPPACG